MKKDNKYGSDLKLMFVMTLINIILALLHVFDKL